MQYSSTKFSHLMTLFLLSVSIPSALNNLIFTSAWTPCKKDQFLEYSNLIPSGIWLFIGVPDSKLFGEAEKSLFFDSLL